MPRRNVRVDIPISSPADMITLVDDILERHLELGAGSPLNDPELDMAGLDAQNIIHTDKRKEGNDLHGEGEPLIQAANTALGTAAGQTSDTEGTVYNLTGRVRDRLLFVHDGEEEELTPFGFNVVIDKSRGKKTVSVEIPISSPKEMIELVDKILEKHTDLGPGSPLNIPELDMAGLQVQHDLHKDKRKEGNKKHGLAEPAIQKADKALGTEEGQTSKTKGTVYNITTRVRDRLLFVHEGEEEELTTYGFNIVISMTPLPGEEEEEEIHTGAVNPTQTLGIADTITDESALTLRNTGTVELIFCRAADAQTVCSPQAGTAVPPASETEIAGLDLGASGAWLNVTNESVDTAGAFEVVIA